MKAHTIGVRPEHFDVAASKGKDKTTITGKVEYAEVLGSDSFLYVTTDHGTVTVREVGSTGFANGGTVYITPQPEHTHRFGEDGKRLN
jgi:multiple sugar transport system ATP-binding protein